MRDYCDEDGARVLGKIIADYWAKRGMIVRLEYVEEAFVPAMRSGYTSIRSNMVNGMPRKTPQVLSSKPMRAEDRAQALDNLILD